MGGAIRIARAAFLHPVAARSVLGLVLAVLYRMPLPRPGHGAFRIVR
jgi:hypothetical protein